MEAGVWILHCRGCSNVFDVPVKADESIFTHTKTLRCPLCQATPQNAGDWHDIVDFKLPPLN